MVYEYLATEGMSETFFKMQVNNLILNSNNLQSEIRAKQAQTVHR